MMRPSEIHDDPGRARLGVGLAAEALGVECDLWLTTQWLVKIDPRTGRRIMAKGRTVVRRSGCNGAPPGDGRGFSSCRLDFCQF